MIDAPSGSPGRALVTGVAGFVGSSLAERLVHDGFDVVGVDAFTSYYDQSLKRRNVEGLLRSPHFALHRGDLLTLDLDPLLDGVDTVFHQAAQPGVRLSWAEGFSTYSKHNIDATQRLLEAVRRRPITRFVFASSSSVYGLASRFPTDETVTPRPFSPYGVTKLAGELLCGAYADNYGVPTVVLRYFTVYGPRQRPDMAIHRLVECALHGRPFTVFGDGTQVRDLTYVTDVVDANLRAATSELPASACINIAGGSTVTLNELVVMLGDVTGRELRIEHAPAAAGDVQQTAASIDAARELLGWKPEVELRDGLAAQLEWQRRIA
jgi:UDP-glucuronate 4-epimerase